MSIDIKKPLMSDDEYEKVRNALITVLEGGAIPTPYFVNGQVTIGIGFNLEGDGDRNKVMSDIGMGLEGEQIKDINDLFNSQSQSAGHQELVTIRTNWANATTAADKKKANNDLGALLSKTIAPRSFSLTDPQSASLLTYFADKKDNKAKECTLVTENSFERAVLCSLCYGGKEPGQPKSLIGPSLLKALKEIADPAEARTEVWYQIRYNSDNQYKRRYVESEVFCLFKDSGNIQKEDAIGAYRVYTRHRIDKPGKEMTKEFDEKHALT